MLRVTQHRSADAAKQYFRSGLSRGDYWVSDQELAGRWGGNAAQRLELAGEVRREDYFALVDNTHPQDGERLTARQRRDRSCLYDFTWDVPKSVSVAYALGRDERILAAFRESVTDTMQELEAEAKTRVRTEGRNEERTTGNLAWADFVHLTTRPLEDGVPDPQLHCHSTVANVTFDRVEERWKAVQFRELKRDAPYWQAAMDARLADRLRELGYGIERHEKGWGLTGVPESVVEKFSRRTAGIEAEAQKRGIEDAKAKAELGARTRAAKRQDITADQLHAAWNERLTADERERLAATFAAAKEQRVDASRDRGGGKAASRSLDNAIGHVYERASVVREKEVLAAALRHGVGATNVADVKASWQERNDVIVHEENGVRRATTKQVLAEEAAMVRMARQGRGRCKPLAEGREIQREFLNGEQRQAIRHLWDSSDRVMILRGAAGTGKTTLMQEAAEGMRSSGAAVHACAPSAEASRGVLRQEGFGNADTLASYLQNEKKLAGLRRQVLWCDEAGLLGVPDTHKLLSAAERHDFRVVLSGDWRQHNSVPRGDALRILEQQAGLKAAEVHAVQRQKNNPRYREAVELLSAGRTQEGFTKLDRLGYVKEIPGDERHERLAADYVSATSNGDTALVVSPTHAEGRRVTEAIRRKRRAEGKLGASEREFERLTDLGWTTAEKADAKRYQLGQILQTHQNLPGGIRRGDRLEVLEVDGERGLRVRRRGDTAPPRTFSGDGAADETWMPLDHPDRFQVFRKDRIGLATGDRVRVTRNGRSRAHDGEAPSALHNGGLHEVAGFTSDGHIRFADGRVVDRNYGHITFGYTTTSYASQGKTVDHVLIAQGSESHGAASQEQFYVAASRGRKSCAIYTDDTAALREQVSRSGQRQSALELAQVQRRQERSRQREQAESVEQQRQAAEQRQAYASQSAEAQPTVSREAQHELR